MPSVTSYSRNRLWFAFIGHGHFYKLVKEFHCLVEVSRVSKQHAKTLETSGTCAMLLLFTTFADPDLSAHANWVNIDFARLKRTELEPRVSKWLGINARGMRVQNNE